MSARNTIVLIGDLSTYHDERRAASGSAIKPGMLLQGNATDEVTQHAVAGGYWEGLVAKEDDMQGRTVDDTYAVGDPVMMHRCQSGDLIQLILKAGQNVAMTGTVFLASNGDGTVKVASGTDQRLFRPGEALDATALGDTFIKAYKL